ncbi:MAG: haloacid dehalogenase [Chloroflexi bacterium]|nr:haloacid dehalogenase [Chloroflexota bacterium]
MGCRHEWGPGLVDALESIVEAIRDDLTRKNEIRDVSLSRSRTLIRLCANSIRATHRHEYALAADLLREAQDAARAMSEDAQAFPDVFYAGYLQDGLKELAEAAITLALVSNEPIPDPDVLGVPSAAYLNGLGEAMGEMRRFALDSIRREDTAEAERLLAIMDEVYSHLVTMDFPDALTGGLRRTTDMVRGVAERTRGDLTTAVRQEKLQEALQAFEARFNERLGDASEAL